MESMIAIVALSNILALSYILCFTLGIRVGQKVVKGEEVKLPNVNPITAYKQYEAKKELQREQTRYDTIMENIDNYDGTPFGQKEVR